MRLFVAVGLPAAAAAAAAELGASLRQRVTRLAPHARLAWVAPDRMHLTVRFLGEVDPGRVPAIAAALADPFAIPAFVLSLGLPGVFPARGAPRVVWVGVDEGRTALVAVEQEMSGRLERAGIAREERPFSPHLTLARVREPGGLRAADLLAGVGAPRGGRGIVDAITLFESRLSPQGPTYTALQRTPLHQA